MRSAPSKQLTVSRNAELESSPILSQLKHLNLHGFIETKEPFVIGHGAFSDIFRGICRIKRRRKVMTAMKRLRMQVDAPLFKDVSSLTPIDLQIVSVLCPQIFEKEIYVWSKLQHPNILPLLGFAFDIDTGYPMLISEWMENGNALAYVRKTDPPSDVLLRLVCLVHLFITT